MQAYTQSEYGYLNCPVSAPSANLHISYLLCLHFINLLLANKRINENKEEKKKVVTAVEIELK